MGRREHSPEQWALAAAGRARLKAAEAKASAAAALARGKQAHAEAEAQLERFKDLDERIASTSAEMVKQGKAARVPADLQAEYDARALARRELEVSAGPLVVLQREYEAADKAFREAQQVMEVEAYRVAIAEAAELGEEIVAAQRRIWENGDKLVGLDLLVNAAAATLPPAAMVALKSDLRKVLAALHNVRPYVPTIAADRNRVAVEEWRARLGQLMG